MKLLIEVAAQGKTRYEGPLAGSALRLSHFRGGCFRLFAIGRCCSSHKYKLAYAALRHFSDKSTPCRHRYPLERQVPHTGQVDCPKPATHTEKLQSF